MLKIILVEVRSGPCGLMVEEPCCTNRIVVVTGTNDCSYQHSGMEYFMTCTTNMQPSIMIDKPQEGISQLYSDKLISLSYVTMSGFDSEVASRMLLLKLHFRI